MFLVFPKTWQQKLPHKIKRKPMFGFHRSCNVFKPFRTRPQSVLNCPGAGNRVQGFGVGKQGLGVAYLCQSPVGQQLVCTVCLLLQWRQGEVFFAGCASVGCRLPRLWLVNWGALPQNIALACAFFYSPNSACAQGFLVRFYRIGPELKVCSSSGCLSRTYLRSCFGTCFGRLVGPTLKYVR